MGSIVIRAFFPVGTVPTTVDDEPGDGADEPWNGDGDAAVDVVDPGRPSTENAAFVLLGALLALFVLGRVAGLV